MGKFNLSDAARAILTEGAKENFGSNIASKHAGQDKPGRLPSSVAYGTKDVGSIGHDPVEKDDENPDYTKGTPTATPPGATPPVGSEPMKKLKGQPQETQGSEQKVVQDPATDYSSIRDRVKAKLAKQTMQANPGATFDTYGEEVDSDEEIVMEDKDEGHEDEAQDKKLIKAMMKKEKVKEKMKEDVDALLGDENLSEEFVTKATTIFEAAVVARTETILEEIENELVEQFEVAVEQVKEDLASKVDDYLNYMVQEWVKDNQLAIDKGIKAEIVEDFIGGLKGLFEEHYINIPEDKVDVVEQLVDRVEELENNLNEQINAAAQLQKELSEQKKIEAIYTACEGLTQTQVEKMKSLAEGIEFTTEGEFAGKLETLKESYFKNSVKAADDSALDDEVLVEEEKKDIKSSDPLIEQYAKTISQTLVK